VQRVSEGLDCGLKSVDCRFLDGRLSIEIVDCGLRVRIVHLRIVDRIVDCGFSQLRKSSIVNSIDSPHCDSQICTPQSQIGNLNPRIGNQPIDSRQSAIRNR
jgi:hypothetical protein